MTTPNYGYAVAPWKTPPPILASNARTARGWLGKCPLCQQLVHEGQRIADLPGNAGTVHVWCAAQQSWAWTG